MWVEHHNLKKGWSCATIDSCIVQYRINWVFCTIIGLVCYCVGPIQMPARLSINLLNCVHSHGHCSVCGVEFMLAGVLRTTRKRWWRMAVLRQLTFISNEFR